MIMIMIIIKVKRKRASFVTQQYCLVLFMKKEPVTIELSKKKLKKKKNQATRLLLGRKKT